jgi:pyruvate kinase
MNGGSFGSKKNVNIPHVRTKLPSVTERDVADIRFGMEIGFDMIAASFIRKPQDVTAIHRILEEQHVSIPVIAKIEDEEGLSNLEEIIRVAGGIMVARGDLGVQLDPEEIPLAQKRIIQKCHAMGKPVITATQMLDSMIKNPRPTRAEVSDVANAIFDGTDAVMLSGETASGAYPVEAVTVMSRIALNTESSDEYREKMNKIFMESKGNRDVVNATCRSACIMADDSGAAAIITPTMSGFTARSISHYRPLQPIVAVTTSDSVQRQLLLNWGVYPLIAPFTRDSEGMIQNAIKAAIKADFAQRQDKVVVAAGLPVNTSLMTNTVRAYYLGTVIGKGEKGFGKRCTGKIVKARTPEEAFIALKKGGSDILLNVSITEEFVPIIRMVKGIIIEGVSGLPWQTLRDINPDLVFISEVPQAMDRFEDGLTVTLDGEDLVIYEGVL